MARTPRSPQAWRRVSTGAAVLTATLAAPAALVAAGSQSAPAPRKAAAGKPAAAVSRGSQTNPGGGRSEAAEPPVTPEAAEFFEKKIRPVLVANCQGCHFSKSASPMGDLRVDALAYLLKGGHRGPAIVPGDPEKSLLIRAVRFQERELQMPPKGKLSDQQIADLVQWVKMGAPWPGSPKVKLPAAASHGFDLQGRKAALWSFQPVKRPALPKVKNTTWPANPIDHFVLARLEQKGLKPAPPADRRTLIRRVTYDLTGLPPTPAEIDAFLADRSPDAYRKIVDRLLASPHYGERWARHWLDLVRFAETDGHEFDFEKPEAWQYRDYLIRAFNADVPYNQFLTEHLAGDLMPQPRRHPQEGFNESIIGTGFYWLGEGKHSPVDIREDEAERVDNQIDVISKTFLGLSLGCARCHDHKFDPISTKDYYALYGYMRSSRFHLAAIDPGDRAREAVAKVAALNGRLQPLLVKQNAEGLLTGMEGMASSLVASAPGNVILVGRSQPNPAPNQAMDKYLREQAAKNPADPLHPWAVLAKRPDNGAAFANAREGVERRLRQIAANSAQVLEKSVLFEDFSKPGYPGWFVTGQAFGEGPNPAAGQIPDGRDGARLWALLPSGTADSSRVSPRLQGTLRSKTFKIEKPWILYRMAGRGAKVNLIIDGFQRIRFPIYGGLTVDLNGGMAWHAMEVGKWVGHQAYVEILDLGDGAVAVDEIRFADAPVPPQAPNAEILRMLADPAIDSPAALAEAYQRLFQESLRQWAGDKELDASPRELVDWLLRQPVLAGSAGAAKREDVAALVAERLTLERSIPAPRRVMAIADGTPENEPVHLRGSHKTLGDVVPRRYLEAFGGDRETPPADGSGRLELARRMTDPRNPLTPRVMVNRLWHHHFGEGIVPTPDDFGFMGQKPTNPELLDYLASEFVRQGWSLKQMHRLMLLSSTYRMSSRPDPKGSQIDPQNKLLHRRSVRRLEAEAVRDAMLAISGRLDRKMYGPGVLPYLTPFMEGRGRPRTSGPLDSEGRRSIYINVRRNFLVPMFLAFDYPIPFTTIGRRSVSTVPAQALTLMNNPFVVEQAGVWARRELAEGGSDRERVQRMYVRAFARPPSEAEATGALKFIAEQAAKYEGNDTSRAWSDLAHVLMNVKEFIFLN